MIVGSGAAGLNCALMCAQNGIPPEEIGIFTEEIVAGTSFNAGSDKQTYYRISQVGDQSDLPYSMAQALFNGGSMHGDIALVEATCSLQAFMHLVGLGVQFPHDQYGSFASYKTDNDPLQRGTSVGP